MVALPALGRLEFDGQERIGVVGHEEDEVGEPSTHAHGLSLGSITVMAHEDALVGTVMQQQPVLRVLAVEPVLATHLELVFEISRSAASGLVAELSHAVEC